MLGNGSVFKGESQAVDITPQVWQQGQTTVKLEYTDPARHWVAVQVRRKVPVDDVVVVRMTMLRRRERGFLGLLALHLNQDAYIGLEGLYGCDMPAASPVSNHASCTPHRLCRFLQACRNSATRLSVEEGLAFVKTILSLSGQRQGGETGKMDSDDDDVQCVSVSAPMPLRCTLTAAPLKEPTRGKLCRHLEVSAPVQESSLWGAVHTALWVYVRTC